MPFIKKFKGESPDKKTIRVAVKKALGISINDTPVTDPGMFASIVSAISSYLSNKRWNDEWLEDMVEDIEEELFGVYEECPACGCDMPSDGSTVCPNCGCDVSKINDCQEEPLNANATSGDSEMTMMGCLVNKSLDSELRQALYVVLEPGVVDLHGDTYSADEVRKGCENFNEFCKKAYLEHQAETDEMKFIESYIAPTDMEFGEEKVTKGTWLMKSQFTPELWGEVKAGKWTGVSIAAYCNTEEIKE